MSLDNTVDIRQQIPKDPVAAVFVISKFFDENWPRNYNNHPELLELQHLDQIEIENFSNAIKIMISAHKRIQSPTQIPDELHRPFGNESMNLHPNSHTFLTKMMPLEARKFSASIAERTDGDFFDDIEPEPYFNLDVKEKSHIFELIAQIRSIVNESDFISDSHKRRLIRRIDKIEYELHKPIGLFDTILAGTREVFDVVEYAGNKSKPLADRYNEIRKITQNKTKDYDAIEGSKEQKRLPAPENCTD